MAATFMTTESLTAELLRPCSYPGNFQNTVVVYHKLLNENNQFFFSVYDIPHDESGLEKSIEDARGYIMNSSIGLCNELCFAIEKSKSTVRFAGDKYVDFSSDSPYAEIKKDADNIAKLVLQVELALKEFILS